MKRNVRLIMLMMMSLLASPVFSQVIISGKVTDTLHQPLSGINILVFPAHSGTLAAYGITNDDGLYSIGVNSDADSLDVLASSIHFEKKKYTLSNRTQKAVFNLKPDTKLLETFTVRASPIAQKGDTLSYLVEQFKGKEDQSIEDVLRKLPGIEVEESGKILYQGMPINKFYVEGLDLTDGRYSMISSNLPYTSVSTVEVFEKHQPIRILEDRVYSPNAAINLKLKKDIAYTGRGKAGVGFSPFLWDANVTPMLLSNGIQLLSSYQTNNTGNDVSMQLQQLTTGNDAAFPAEPDKEMLLFNAGSVNQYGAIDPKRYLDNQVHLVNFNALVPLKNELQLRANVFFVDDIRLNHNATNRLFLLPDDSLQVIENVEQTQRSRFWQGAFDLNRNSKRNYLKNKTQFKFNEQKFHDYIVGSTDTVMQEIDAPFQQLSNQLNSIFRVGTSLVEIQSLIQYQKGPQQLIVVPGVFEQLVNTGLNYDTAIQKATLERFYADHYVGSNFKWRRWVLSWRLGFAIRLQQQQTNLLMSENNVLSEPGNEFRNQLESTQYQLYLVPAAKYQYKRFRFSLDWPLNSHQLILNDKLIDKQKVHSRLLQAPAMNADYTFGGFWDLRASWHYAQRLGDPDDFQNAYMLRNYRQLTKTDVLLNRSSQQLAGISLSYRNAITAFFNTFSYYFVQREMNLTYQTNLQEDGSLTISAFERPNTSFSHSIKFKSSKYVASLKSTFSIDALLMRHEGKTLVNEAMFNTTTSQFMLRPEIYYRLSSWMNINYQLQFHVMKTAIGGALRNQIKLNKHIANLNIFPKENQMFNISFEYYSYNRKAYNFTDLMYRYSFPDTKFYLEFRWNNLLNSNNFLEQQLSQYMVTTYTQQLRPSQIMVSLKFSF